MSFSSKVKSVLVTCVPAKIRKLPLGDSWSLVEILGLCFNPSLLIHLDESFVDGTRIDPSNQFDVHSFELLEFGFASLCNLDNGVVFQDVLDLWRHDHGVEENQCITQRVREREATDRVVLDNTVPSADRLTTLSLDIDRTVPVGLRVPDEILDGLIGLQESVVDSKPLCALIELGVSELCHVPFKILNGEYWWLEDFDRRSRVLVDCS